jgi:hypothetical protein
VQDTWKASVVMAMAECTAVMNGLTATGASVQTLNDQALMGTMDAQKVNRFTANASALKKKLIILDSEVSRLRRMLNSGKTECDPKADIERLKTKFGNSLLQLRDMKKLTVERVKKWRIK